MSAAANDNDLSLASDLVDGLLQPNRAEELERRRETDTDFNELVQWQLALRQVVTDKEKARLKLVLNQERKQQKRSDSLKIGGIILASILLLILLAYTLWRPSPTNDVVYAAYYKPYSWSLNSKIRGPGQPTDLLSSVHGAYQRPREESSIPAFERLVAAYPDSTEYQFYFANLLLERGEYERAIILLEMLNDGKTDRKKWYLGLAFLANGDQEKALEIFKSISSEEPYFFDRAGNIITELD